MSTDRETRLPPDEAAIATTPEVDQPLLLVVDDDQMVRWSTARTLRRAGYEVLEAEGVEEALICLQEHGARVRLVLSDVIMPKRSGYELGQEVRTHWPDVQVVLISGYTPVAMDRHVTTTCSIFGS